MNIRFPVLVSSLLFLGGCSEESATEEIPQASSGATTPATRPKGMVLIPGGSFLRGGDAGEMGGDSFSHQSAYPVHEVHVDAFWIDEAEVTNREFMKFVKATGYKTFAERPLPEVRVQELRENARRNLARLELLVTRATGKEREEMLASIERLREASEFAPQAGSMIFAKPKGELDDPQDISQWWKLDPAANWRTPGGTGTTLEGLDDHPVVNVTHEDAAAYARWAGKRLPTEAEWEKAARGGLDHQPYTWGSEMFPKGENVWMANIWQGEWPRENTEKDGFYTTAPVKRFPPNRYGLFDMSGNVWEVVADLFHPDAYRLPSATVPNPGGPPAEIAVPPGSEVTPYVTKGGSFLCSDVWCKGYQPGSRQQIDNESPSNHTGFRCAMNAVKAE
ncbi:MAG: formylglycine-generating enzyme family protein [Verrucomicrobiales bacterium]|nr:formylglycine-generating enzyme family protein [Verrucomicrobiales bacterium]